MQTGFLHVPAFMPGVLFSIFAIAIHRPDVHGAIQVGDEVDPFFIGHGRMRFSLDPRGQIDRLSPLLLESPDIPCGSTLITFHFLSMKPRPDKVQSAVTCHASVTRFRKGDSLPRLSATVKHNQLIGG